MKVQYQNVWLTCQRIRLTFGFFFFFFSSCLSWFFHFFCFHLFIYYSFIHNGISLYIFHLFSYFTIVGFFLGVFLFRVQTSLRIPYKFKSPSIQENWHFNPSLFAPLSNSITFRALGKVENAFLLATTLWRFTKLAMSILELVKKQGSWHAFNNVFNS